MLGPKRCYVCNRPAEIWWWQQHAGNEVKCDYCGYYRIGNLAAQALSEQWQSGTVDPLLSYLPAAIRQAAEPPTVTLDVWKELARPHAERSHSDRLRMVLDLLKQRSSFRGELVAFESDKDMPLVDLGRDEEAEFVLNELVEKERIEGTYPLYKVTPKGWDTVEAHEGISVGRVFLSHAAVNAELAALLATEVRARLPDVEVFVSSQPGQIRTGEKWLEAVEKRLSEGDTYLILLTPASVERPWLWFETGSVWFHQEKRLIPVVADGLGVDGIPYPLSARQALNLDKPAHVQQLFLDLGAEISAADADALAERFRKASSE